MFRPRILRRLEFHIKAWKKDSSQTSATEVPIEEYDIKSVVTIWGIPYGITFEKVGGEGSEDKMSTMR